MDFFHAIGDFEAAAQLQFEAFEDFRRAGNAVEGRTYLFYAAQFRTHSDLKWSLSMLEQQCLPLERAYSRDGRANASILSQLALVSRLAGHPERAASYLAEALDLCRGREESDSNGYLHALRVGGRAAINDGDLALALERFEKCLPVARRVGNTFAMAGSLCSLAELAHETGDREQEQKYLAEAITVAGGDPAVRLAQVLRHQRAELLLALGDRTGATALAVETLNLLRGKALSCRLHTYSLLLLLADGELTERPEPHRTERAARLVGVAAGIAVRLGLVAPERADRERAARLHAALLGLLGPERLAKEESTGAALDDAATLEFAIAAGR